MSNKLLYSIKTTWKPNLLIALQLKLYQWWDFNLRPFYSKEIWWLDVTFKDFFCQLEFPCSYKEDKHLTKKGSLLPVSIQVYDIIILLLWPVTLSWSYTVHTERRSTSDHQYRDDSVQSLFFSVESKCVQHELHVEALQGYGCLFCWLSSAPFPCKHHIWSQISSCSMPTVSYFSPPNIKLMSH